MALEASSKSGKLRKKLIRTRKSTLHLLKRKRKELSLIRTNLHKRMRKASKMIRKLKGQRISNEEQLEKAQKMTLKLSQAIREELLESEKNQESLLRTSQKVSHTSKAARQEFERTFGKAAQRLRSKVEKDIKKAHNVNNTLKQLIQKHRRLLKTANDQNLLESKKSLVEKIDKRIQDLDEEKKWDHYPFRLYEKLKRAKRKVHYAAQRVRKAIRSGSRSAIISAQQNLKEEKQRAISIAKKINRWKRKRFRRARKSNRKWRRRLKKIRQKADRQIRLFSQRLTNALAKGSTSEIEKSRAELEFVRHEMERKINAIERRANESLERLGHAKKLQFHHLDVRIRRLAQSMTKKTRRKAIKANRKARNAVKNVQKAVGGLYTAIHSENSDEIKDARKRLGKARQKAEKAIKRSKQLTRRIMILLKAVEDFSRGETKKLASKMVDKATKSYSKTRKALKKLAKIRSSNILRAHSPLNEDSISQMNPLTHFNHPPNDLMHHKNTISALEKELNETELSIQEMAHHLEELGEN